MMTTRIVLAALAWAVLAWAQPAASTLEAEQWRSDLAFLAREIPTRHVNPFTKIRASEFAAQVESLRARLPRLSLAEIRTGVQQLVSSIGDAHTDVWSWGRSNRIRVLPVGLYWFKDGIFVVAASAEHSNLLGARVERIGRMSAEEAARTLARLVPHENEAQLKARVPSAMTTADFLAGTGVIETPDRAWVAVQPASGLRVTAYLQSAERERMPEMTFVPLSGEPLYRQNGDRAYWAKTADEGTTVYFHYRRCQEDSRLPMAAFRTGLAELLAGENVRRLVVDLRNNSGGNSGLLDPWIDELKEGPFARKGRLFVIVGRRTFSSAILNAIRLRDEAHAILVGEPTGGRPNHFGEVRSFELPNSRTQIGYSTKYFRHSKVDTDSLVPDIAVEQTYEEFAAGKDPAMEAIRRQPAVK